MTQEQQKSAYLQIRAVQALINLGEITHEEDYKVLHPILVGELNEYYRCIQKLTKIQFYSKKILLLGERIYHIECDDDRENHHPEAFSQYGHYIPEILQEPDYILKGKRENSYLILKKIGDEYFILVLWIKSSPEPKNFENSIHTFYRVKLKKWKKKIKKEENILYKKV